MLNLAGALVYLAVSALAIRAALQSHRGVRPKAAAFHWWAVALLFAGLAAWRFAEGEALAQGFARGLALDAGSYASRREWQVPLVGLAALAGAAYTVWAFIGPRADTNVHWSRLAAIGLLVYSAVRMVSLHAVDAILYTSIGPFHLNHFIDLGLTAMVGYFASISTGSAGAVLRKF